MRHAGAENDAGLRLLWKGSRLVLRLRGMNPGFCGEEMQDKADPEGDAEKFMRRQT